MRHQSSGKTHSNPQRISQNGALVVWAPMRLGCYSFCQTNVYARLDSIHSQRWRHKCRWTHRHKHTQGRDHCINTGKGSTVSSLRRDRKTEKENRYVVLLFFHPSVPIVETLGLRINLSILLGLYVTVLFLPVCIQPQYVLNYTFRSIFWLFNIQHLQYSVYPRSYQPLGCVRKQELVYLFFLSYTHQHKIWIYLFVFIN